MPSSKVKVTESLSFTDEWQMYLRKNAACRRDYLLRMGQVKLPLTEHQIQWKKRRAGSRKDPSS